MYLTKLPGKFRLLTLCTWGPSRRADICSSFRYEFTFSPLSSHPSVMAEIKHCWWIILLALSQYSCRPIRQTRTRSPRRIWSGSLWFSSLAHTDLQVIHSIFGIISRHTFLIFRIHPCWLLCEHWLHWAWAERDAPLPPSLGKTPAQHLGHQSQVLLKLWICDWNTKFTFFKPLPVSEWPSSRSTGTEARELLRTPRTFRPREIQTSFLTTLRSVELSWDTFLSDIYILSRWTLPWNQPMVCQQQQQPPWRLNKAFSWCDQEIKSDRSLPLENKYHCFLNVARFWTQQEWNCDWWS